MARLGGSAVRGVCGCGSLTALKGLTATGEERWRSRCQKCLRAGRKQKKGYCEHCLVVPKDKRELQIDHIDKNPSNNDLSNLQTLCAKCHIVKTNLNKDWMSNVKVCNVLSNKATV